MGVIMTIRDKFGYVLVGGIAFAIILFLLGDALGTGNSMFQATSNDAGSVDGEAISYNAFSLKLDKNMQNFLLQSGKTDVSEEEMGTLREQTWNELVREKLLAREFEKLGIAVTKDEIYQMFFGPNPHPYIAQNFTDPSTGQFNALAVQNYIDNLDVADGNGTAEEKRSRWTNFEQALIRERLESKYTTLLKQSVYVPKWYATALGGFKNASVNVEYVYLPFSGVSDDQIKVTDSDLKSYLNAHQAEFKQEEYRVVDYVTFTVVPSALDTAKAAEELDTMYSLLRSSKNDSAFVNRNSETPYLGEYLTREELVLRSAIADTFFVVDTMSYVGPYFENGLFTVAKLMDRKMLPDSVEVAVINFRATSNDEMDTLVKLADTLVKQINEGTLKFADLYATYGSDSVNIVNAGTNGVLGWVKAGETTLVSPYVQRQLLYYQGQDKAVLFYDNTGLVQIAYAKTSTPTKMAVKVAFLSKPVIAGKETEKFYYDNANEFFAAHNTADLFSAEKGVSIQTSVKIKKGDNIVVGMGAARELVKGAYNAKKGDVLPPVVLDGKYVVAMVKEAVAGGVPTVDEVRTQLEVAVKTQKKADLLKDKIGADKDLTSIANKNGTTVNQAQNLNLNNNTIGSVSEPSVAGASLGLAQGQVSTPIVGKAGVYVIKVTSTTPGTIDEEGAGREKQMQGFTLQNQVDTKYYDALENNATVVDERFKFY
jgi:peptidyl-prolyl cis-trans isomerase D